MCSPIMRIDTLGGKSFVLYHFTLPWWWCHYRSVDTIINTATPYSDIQNISIIHHYHFRVDLRIQIVIHIIHDTVDGSGERPLALGPTGAGGFRDLDTTATGSIRNVRGGSGIHYPSHPNKEEETPLFFHGTGCHDITHIVGSRQRSLCLDGIGAYGTSLDTQHGNHDHHHHGRKSFGTKRRTGFIAVSLRRGDTETRIDMSHVHGTVRYDGGIATGTETAMADTGVIRLRITIRRGGPIHHHYHDFTTTIIRVCRGFSHSNLIRHINMETE